ncbi:GmrSD restriction endonuclease domain-containing protein [Brachybacterium sp. AOP43-C2-M15]|uniref:GmrSD restriction endonuclease domain-containing protein n=1 Tax=Brachybacterium sp. AOP43-C2-M15 TaxID=3457661 RepID=UPI004034D1C9
MSAQRPTPQHPTPPRRGDDGGWFSAPVHRRQRPLPVPAKSYPIAWALSLFLGVWGADRFYLGRWKTGLLKFATVGGLFLWWIIDLVLLTAGAMRDAKGRPLRQFETVKWPSRIISAAVVMGLVGMMALGSTVEPPPQPAAADGGGGAAVLMEEESDQLSELPEEETPTAEETESPSASPTTPESTPSETPSPTPSPTPTPSPSPEVVEPATGTAAAMLAGLEEKGRAPKTGYDRDSFGWRDDLDRNGCDTRNDILRRDLHTITLKQGTKGCVVLRGTLESPFSGDTVAFDRTDSTVDIDHVVALSDAWQTGAASWDVELRREFANDPLNLLAVESGLNRQKGDGDAATWLPPKKDYRCEYVARQISVKDKYDLWVKPAEADAMEGVLADCEGFLAVADDDQWPAAGEGDVVATEAQETAAPSPDPAPAPAPAPAEDDGSGSGGGGSVHYKNCDAARAAGAAPVHRGDPGYAKHLDRDGDGVGCE